MLYELITLLFMKYELNLIILPRDTYKYKIIRIMFRDNFILKTLEIP